MFAYDVSVAVINNIPLLATMWCATMKKSPRIINMQVVCAVLGSVKI